jgi:deoxyribodipyrimidine photo-lyase
MNFPTSYTEIVNRIKNFDPSNYGQTRNYIDGNVSHLSPYISRGVISTKLIYQELKNKGYKKEVLIKYTQELAWRDYWQRVWCSKGEEINSDLKNKQFYSENNRMPISIIDSTTGISAIDKGISTLQETGYMHNHIRMYLASIACNIARSQWQMPAKWMYYHLLDADWASNALSWQWVSGANSNKAYFANQENINQFCNSPDSKTFLDVSYSDFPLAEIPQELKELTDWNPSKVLPLPKSIEFDEALPSYIYTFYNLDPEWRKDEKGNRILILEPSHFNEYPVSSKTIDFTLALGENIEGLQLFLGEFAELKKILGQSPIFYKEHPISNHFEGHQDPRDWLSTVDGYHSSFFKFWKLVQKELFES